MCTSSKTTSRGQLRKAKRVTKPSARSTSAVCLGPHRGGGGGSFGEVGPPSSSRAALSVASAEAMIASSESVGSMPSSRSRFATSTRSRPRSPARDEAAE